MRVLPILIAAALAAGSARAEIGGRFSYGFYAPELGGMPPKGTTITMTWKGQSSSFSFPTAPGAAGPETDVYEIKGIEALRRGLEVTVVYTYSRIKCTLRTTWNEPDKGQDCHQLNIRVAWNDEMERWRLVLEKVEPEPEPKPEPVKPGPSKPDPPKPEPTQPEPAKPEPPNPGPAKPDPPAPEPAKPQPAGEPIPV
jgi:hypothetical protein